MRSYEQRQSRQKRAPKPLDAARLRELALSYVARFATSSGKLEAYLQRKVRERGWEEEEAGSEGGAAGIAALVREFAERGYIDDDAYARARSADLLRRGYGGRRVGEALRHAGIDEQIRANVAPGEAQARHAALRLAQKRRFGPFAAEHPDRDRQQKQLAAMLRAGHAMNAARFMVQAASEDEAISWASELDEEGEHDF